MEEVKSLDRWHHELRSLGKSHWVTFYDAFLGTSPSNLPRFYRAINLYGHWPMFEAIVESSDRSLEGDALGYVITVAKNKFKESQTETDAASEYVKSVEESKKNTRTANKVLEKRIRERGKS